MSKAEWDAKYAEYLASEAWKTLRRQVLERDGHACRVCPSTTRLQVHHRHYKNVFKEELADLVTLCDPCHARHHGKAATPVQLRSVPSPAGSKPSKGKRRKKSKKKTWARQPPVSPVGWRQQFVTFLKAVPGATSTDVALRFQLEHDAALQRLKAMESEGSNLIVNAGHGWWALSPDGNPIRREERRRRAA